MMDKVKKKKEAWTRSWSVVVPGSAKAKRRETAKLVGKAVGGSVAITVLYLGTVAVLMSPAFHGVPSI